jgi:ferrochelatase
LIIRITYQSKVTPVKWLEPSTEKEIEIAVKTQKALVIVPIAFVSEHSETLVELDIEYKSIADKYKIEYLRVPALGTDKDFISALANIVKEKSLEKKNLVSSDKKSRICPREFCKCICEI